MYKTKEMIKAWDYSTGEQIKTNSSSIVLWSKETDKWYDLTEKDKKKSYQYVCAKITENKNWDKFTLAQQMSILSNSMQVFKYAQQIDIPNPELIMIMNEEDLDHNNYVWVSMDDLESM